MAFEDGLDPDGVFDAAFFDCDIGGGGVGREFGFETAGVGGWEDEFCLGVGEEEGDKFCADVAAGGRDEDCVGD